MARLMVLLSLLGYLGMVGGSLATWQNNGAKIGSAEQPVILRQIGARRGYGNVIGIQPDMTASDYRSAATFLKKLDRYLAAAQQKGWIDSRTVVVFPEMIGFYLFTVDENEAVYQARSLQEAAGFLIAEHHIMPSGDPSTLSPQEVARQLNQKLLGLKAARMAAVYQETFATLARRYEVTICAGSLLLFSPAVREGRLTTEDAGRLENISATFRSDGSLYPQLAKKVFPTAEECGQLGVAAGPLADLPVYSTPLGKVGVAVCADSWYPQTYQVLQRKGAGVVVIPAYLDDTHKMKAPWNGYSFGPGGAAPADVSAGDVRKLSEEAAWVKYAMAGRMGATPQRAGSIPYGMTVFLHGNFWGKEAANLPPFVLDRGRQRKESAAARDANVLSFWLPSPPFPETQKRKERELKRVDSP